MWSALGFKQPAAVAETLKRWLAGEYRALRAEATREALEGLLPLLLSNLARAENPDGALTQFDSFLQAVQRGATLLALLQQNPDLVSLIASIVGAAPRLGDMLAQQPRLMDGLVDPRFFGAMPRREEISQRLKAALADADSYEEFLDRLRLFGQESLFLIGSRILSGTVSAQLGRDRLCRRGRRHRQHHPCARDRPVRAPARRHQGPADRHHRHGAARQPRDDGVIRSRPDLHLRFRSRAARTPTARARCRVGSILRG